MARKGYPAFIKKCTMEESKNKGKKIECIIGIIFLIPPILGVVAFVLGIFGCNWNFAELRHLSGNWTFDYSSNGGGGMSAAPIYLGLMALAGVWLVKDSIQYLFERK